MSNREPPSPEIEKLLQAAFVGPPSDEVRARHLAAMSGALAETHAAARNRRLDEAPLRRRRAGLVARAAALAAGVVVVSGGALAATGGLPDGAQDVVANAVRSVVDLPGGDDETRPGSTPSSGDEGEAKAEQNRSEAEEYTASKQAWTECVAAEAPEHEGPGPFDPEEACGPKPRPAPATDAPGRQPETDETSPPGKGLEEAPGQQGEGKAKEHGPPSPRADSGPGRRPESAGRRP